jgi:hypothetical protein
MATLRLKMYNRRLNSQDEFQKCCPKITIECLQLHFPTNRVYAELGRESLVGSHPSK